MLGNAMKACTQRPSLWINASASAIYPSEITMPAGESAPVTDHTFLSQVVAQWENFFLIWLSRNPSGRFTNFVVLGHGGAFEPLYQLSRSVWVELQVLGNSFQLDSY
jgi:NAD dependent epimerase/dehydratase family enzyme